MSDEGANGQAPAVEQQTNGGSPGPVSSEVAALAAQLGVITAPVKTVVDAMIRGMLLQHHNVAPHVILNAIAWQTGNVLGTVLQGDLQQIFLIRQGMQEAFADGVKKAPVVDPAAKQVQRAIARG